MWVTVNLFPYFQIKDLDDVKKVTSSTKKLSKQFPTIMETLVDERDQLIVFSPSFVFVIWYFFSVVIR